MAAFTTVHRTGVRTSMSAHTQPAAHAGSSRPTPAFPQHVVTAVLVSHDGERWLPDVLAGLLGQDRPVQDVVAADTGSADSSATLVTEALGADRVLHLARRTSFGTAVAEAARTAPVLTPDDLPYLRRPPAWDPVTRSWNTSTYDLPELPHGEPVHWLWLLHDDAAPEPGALAALLRQADASPGTAIVGAKLRGWYDRRQLLEVGVSLAHSGRRWTGLDRREQDQGQHDQVRPVLSVSTAGMLVRRDVFEQLGGFDRRLPLMRDDVDLCWRAHAAGHGVLVAPDAVLRHAEAASRERRSIDCAGRLGGGSPHRVDKAAAAYTLLVNTRLRQLPWVLFRLVLGTLLRVLAYLVGKLPGRALDEAAGLLTTLLRPGRILGARRRRRGVIDPRELRPLFPPHGATVRATVEQVLSTLSGRSEPAAASAGRHGAVESGPTDDEADDFEVEQFARVRRIARKPGPMLFFVLLLAALLACRDLIAGGSLAGGALLPAPDDVSALWQRSVETWQPVGTGGTTSAPPYLGLLALLSTLLLGSPGLALFLLLVCSVPLAGASAYFTSRSLIASRLLRACASIAYAFLPAVTGALASGRIGTAVLAVLLPPLVRTAVLTAGYASGNGKGSWRATWACALLLALGTAFTPVIWPLTLVLALCATVLPLRSAAELRGARAVRFAVVLLTPLAVLSPWSWSVLGSPSRFLREAGVLFPTRDATGWELLNANPAGPGTSATWLFAGLVLAALAALLRRERRLAIGAAWTAALVALLFAVWSNAAAWAGPATLGYGLALLCAATLGADGARGRVAEQSFGWRQPVAVAVAAAAAAGPLLAAAGWILSGAAGPLERRDPVQVPAFVAEESSTRDQARTLVLSGAGDRNGAPDLVSYALVRGSGARLGDADLGEQLGSDCCGNPSLRQAVGDLVAGSGADQTHVLAGYAVRYVLVQPGSPPDLHRVLDTTPGLKRLSQEGGSALWRVERDLSRVMLLPAEDASLDTEPIPVAAGPVEVDTELPDGPAGRVLRLADAASDDWRATLGDIPLKPVTLDGWAQGFELPAGGGRLVVTHHTADSHQLWRWTQGLLLLVLAVLALPGRRRELDDDLPEPAAVPTGVPGGRRARRLAAEAATPEDGGAARAMAQATVETPAETPASAVPPPRTEPGSEPTAQWDASPAYQESYPQDGYHAQPAPYPSYPSYPGGQPVPEQPGYGAWDDQPHDRRHHSPYPGAAPHGHTYDHTRDHHGPDYPADYGDGGSQQ